LNNFVDTFRFFCEQIYAIMYLKISFQSSIPLPNKYFIADCLRHNPLFYFSYIKDKIPVNEENSVVFPFLQSYNKEDSK